MLKRIFSISIIVMIWLSGLVVDQARADSISSIVQGDTATIWHTDTYRNCGSLFTMDVQISDNLITITEVDTGEAMFCMCYFDLSVTIGPLEPGDYTAEIYSTD
ncbi:MAG: hypothetical protein GY869_16815, partial [Planctomycetes bacterium]|nr:hypothetical protein [Planctomycetota bacterium]